MTEGKRHRRNEEAIMTLANNIRKYRRERNLTINQLALEIGVDYSQIGRMERGTINPNISIIYDIAQVLKIEPYLLLIKENQ